MISIPSISRDEGAVASVLEDYLAGMGIKPSRKGNNLWVYNKHFDPAKKTVLLNSHIDTVKPNPNYTRDPFSPDIEDGKLYGLGSNDAGASVVSLLAAFTRFYEAGNLKYNLCLALTAEEECTGADGVESILPEIRDIEFAMVGEPTGMDPAVAEKGLMVVACKARGVPGHAARGEGVNAIYEAVKDIEWFRNYEFPRVSRYLGKIMMSVTVINGGTQHNVVPAECDYLVDVRITDQYTHEEVLETIRRNVKSEVTPRSLRLRPSSMAEDHVAVAAAVEFGGTAYGSPTTSDQTVMKSPSFKIGPGDSSRSHSADEYILLSEIEDGITKYIKILDKVLKVT